MLHETLEYLGIAFVSSALLIIMSKIILQALIRRPADYYDAEELRQEELMLSSAGISITKEHETNPEGEPIEESHLEAHIDHLEPVEPEEIITDIPDAVHESIEIIPDDEESEEETGDEDAAFEEPEEVIEIHETEDYIDLPEEVAAEEPETVAEEPAAEEAEVSVEEPEPVAVEPEPVIEEPDVEKPETEELEPAVEEPEPSVIEETEPELGEAVVEESEPEPEEAVVEEPEPSVIEEPEPEHEEAAAEEPIPEPETAEQDFTFKIKAKTSRTKKPKRLEDEEKAEEEAAARAAMEAAQAAAGDDRVPAWPESYEDIRNSLEKAFVEKRNNPSMRMTKKELIEIAESYGIEVPEKAVKKQILELIHQATDNAGERQDQ